MEDLHITYRQSKRAKNIGIRIIPGGEVIVTTPAGVHPASGERFLREKLSWVRKHIGKMSSFVQVCPPRTRTNYLKFKEQALRYGSSGFWSKTSVVVDYEYLEEVCKF